MMTLKLYGHCRTRIVEAVSFTVWHYSDYSKQITAHQDDASDDRCFYIGAMVQGQGVESELWYDRGFIENAHGKTTESIVPPLFTLPKDAPVDAPLPIAA